MYDNITDDMIQKFEEIILRFKTIQEQQERLEKDINNFYSYLFSLQRLTNLKREE